MLRLLLLLSFLLGGTAGQAALWLGAQQLGTSERIGLATLGSGQTILRASFAAAAPVPAVSYGLPYDQRTTDLTGGAGDGSFSTLAGQWWGGPDDDANADTLDGLGAAAKFYLPNGLCVGADGFLYVSEFGFEPNSQGWPEKTAGNCIRRVHRTTGNVITFVGLPGQAGGFVDGNAATAQFHGLVALFPTTTGLLLCEYYNDAVRFITYGGQVSTVATNIAGANGIVMAADGTIFVAAFDAGQIIRITPQGVRTTLATLARCANLYVTDDQTGLIVTQFDEGKISRVEIATGTVSTLSESAGTNVNGGALGSTSLYYVCAGPAGAFSDIVRKMALASPYGITTLAGVGGEYSDPASHFYGLSCIAFDGTHLFIGDAWGGRVLKMLP